MGGGDFVKKYPAGHVIGEDFADNGFPEGLHVGILVRIDDLNMKGDVKPITRGGQVIPEVDLTQAMCGPRSFWGGVPEVNSLVVLAYRKRHKKVFQPMVIAFLPISNKSGLRFDPFAPTNPKEVPTNPDEKAIYDQYIGKTVRQKRLKLRSGNVGGMSSDGAEFVLSKDVRMVNRAGDLIELRDSERTLVTQAIHRFDSASGVKHYVGPVRRSDNYLPPDIFSSGRKLKTQADRYFGADELQNFGPGAPGSASKYANSSGTVLNFFNDTKNFPPVTYSNGKRVFYPSTTFGVSIEDVENGGGATFTEDRMEMTHDTDLVQEVLNEIDGFTISKRRTYIERVYGTTVGNDSASTEGLRVYGKVLRPGLWPTFGTRQRGKFLMSEVERAAKGNTDTLTTAGAFLLRIWSPYGVTEDPFALVVEKQGKVYLNVPKPTVERYPDDSGVSVEANLLGALKMFIGGSDRNNTSIHATLAGGIKAEIGHNTDTGNAIDVTYHSGVSATYKGVDAEGGYTKFEDIRGNYGLTTTGDVIESIDGLKSTTVSGTYQMQGDRISMNAFNGLGLNVGQLDVLVAQKSQYQYALQVLETIVAGGRATTVLAGGITETIVAGGRTNTVLAGGYTTTVAGGAYAVNVAAGAITMTTASGAMALSAGAGAVSVNAGLAMTLTAGLAVTITAAANVTLTAPLVLLGGPTAVLGVCRGVPSLPPGTPTLDPISGAPLLGALTVLSN